MGSLGGRTGPYHSAPAVEDKEPGVPEPGVVDGLSWVIYHTVAVTSREVIHVPQG
jgi:hypothetical protein